MPGRASPRRAGGLGLGVYGVQQVALIDKRTFPEVDAVNEAIYPRPNGHVGGTHGFTHDVYRYCDLPGLGDDVGYLKQYRRRRLLAGNEQAQLHQTESQP